MKKTFISAVFTSDFLKSQYITATILINLIFFLVSPFVYYSKASLQSSSHQLIKTLIGLIIIDSIAIGIFFSIRWESWVLKISTDDCGITYDRRFKKFYASWNEITSVETYPTRFFMVGGDQIRVRTKNKSFNFYSTMREEEVNHPKITGGLFSWWDWKDADGVRKSIKAENCPLHIEIQKHLQQRT